MWLLYSAVTEAHSLDINASPDLLAPDDRAGKGNLRPSSCANVRLKRRCQLELWSTSALM